LRLIAAGDHADSVWHKQMDWLIRRPGMSPFRQIQMIGLASGTPPFDRTKDSAHTGDMDVCHLNAAAPPEARPPAPHSVRGIQARTSSEGRDRARRQA
jgi:hypothetical protein